MKTKNLYFAFVSLGILSLSACSTETKVEEKNINEVEESMAEKEGQVLDANDPRLIGGEKSADQSIIEMAQSQIANSSSELLGYWVGIFGKGTINVSLSEVTDSTVKGHTVCYGNFRPITGKISKVENGVYNIEMEEPGDDKYDGKFNFTLDTKNEKCTGNWEPFKEESTSGKRFELKKKEFVYNPKVGQFPMASERLLTEEDLDNMVGAELEIMRNEIYARHGYSFRNEKMRTYFADQDWYVPMGVDIRESLTDIEAKNIKIIKRFEDYFDNYYDYYGR